MFLVIRGKRYHIFKLILYFFLLLYFAAFLDVFIRIMVILQPINKMCKSITDKYKRPEYNEYHQIEYNNWEYEEI